MTNTRANIVVPPDPTIIYRLYIKQPSSFSLSGNDDEPEWAEYKIKETNMFTVDKYQQVSSHPNPNICMYVYTHTNTSNTV